MPIKMTARQAAKLIGERAKKRPRIPFAPWEEDCDKCKGTCQLGELPCPYCGGTGVEWTDEGRNLMAFLRHNLRMKAE